MSRYIDADYVLVEAENIFSDMGDYGWLKRIFENPSTPSIEPKRGEWKPFDLTWGRSIWYCTACEESTEVPCDIWEHKPIYKYCPNCGADMRNCSEKPNNCEPKICDTCRYYNSNIPCGSTPSACKEADKFAEEFVDGLKKLKPKDEPQTDTEIAKAIVHKMIDDAVIAEDEYPDLRQKMHDAVDEYEPQTEREGE